MIPSVADLLRASWRLYRSSIGLLSGYLAWMLLPQIGLVLVPFIPSAPVAMGARVVLMTAIVGLFLWISLLLLRILSAAAKGQPESLADVVASARVRFLPYVAANVLKSLAVLIGTLLLIIPGVLCLVWYAFAPLEAALNGRRGMEALLASRALVQGRFWPVLWRLLAGPLTMLVWYAVGMALLFIPLLLLTNTPIEAVSGDQPPLWFSALDTVGQLFLLTPLLLCYTVLLYHSLVDQTLCSSNPSSASKSISN